MNVSVEDFTQSDYEEYMSYAIDQYAEANAKAGRWSAENAKAGAQDQFDRLLKDGFDTEGHAFWKVCLDGEKVGIFWYFQFPKNPKKIFVYDTTVVEQHRNQGVGTTTFPLILERLKTLGIEKISLHVFSHNTDAIRLYERLGFECTSQNMSYSIPT